MSVRAPILLVLLACLAAACGRSATSRSAPTAKTAQPEPGGSLTTGSLSAVDPRLEVARTEPDFAARVAVLDSIANDPTASRAAIRLARIHIVRTWAEAGMLAEMEKAAGAVEIPDDVDGADLLDRMAKANVEKNGDLDRALRHSRRALEVVQSLQRNRDVDSALWKRQRAATIAAYRDTLGWVLVKAGDARGGYLELRQAAAVLPDDVAVNYHLGVALLALGESVRAVDAFARSIAGEGPESVSAETGIRAAGVKAGLQELDWKQKITAARGTLAAKVREPALAAVVPDAPPIAGAPEDEGSRQLVVFWASYDARSLQAVRQAARLHEDSKKTGEFHLRTVCLDRTNANAASGVSKIGLPFVWDLDLDGTKVAAYGVRTIPTVLVLDVNGRVRYRNEGVVPGYQAILRTQLDSLQEGR